MTFKTKIIILSVCMFSFLPIPLSSHVSIKSLPTPIEKNDDEFTRANLEKYMEEIGIKYINFTLAQAIHESGNFTSRRFVQDNNMFGMKKAEIRKTTAIKTRNGYAVYGSWKKSVEDFFLMQEKILIKHKTKTAYVRYIAKNYAKDPQYMQKLQKYIE